MGVPSLGLLGPERPLKAAVDPYAFPPIPQKAYQELLIFKQMAKIDLKCPDSLLVFPGSLQTISHSQPVV